MAEERSEKFEKIGSFVCYFSSPGILTEAYVLICRHLYRSSDVLPLNQKRFEKLVQRVRSELKGLVPQLCDLLEVVFKARQRLSVEKRGYPGMADDLARLVPKDFLLTTPYKQLKEYPRYF